MEKIIKGNLKVSPSRGGRYGIVCIERKSLVPLIGKKVILSIKKSKGVKK